MSQYTSFNNRVVVLRGFSALKLPHVINLKLKIKNFGLTFNSQAHLSSSTFNDFHG